MRRTNQEVRWNFIIHSASENNLKNIDVSFPVGLLTVVCGVSGSGKSTLVNEILAKSAANELHRAKHLPGAHSGIEGLEFFEQAVRVDQSPIGKSPRSNPATYVKLFDLLRKLFSQCSLSRIRGYNLVDLVLIYQEEDVSDVREMVWLNLICNFLLMFLLSARVAGAAL